LQAQGLYSLLFFLDLTFLATKNIKSQTGGA